MTVDFLYSLYKHILNKTQRGGASASRFNIVIKQAQTSFVQYLIGEYQKYLPGRAVPPVALGATKKVRQALSPVIGPPVQLTVNNATGIAPYPTGYLYADAMYTSDKKRIRYVEQNELDAFLDSVIDPVVSNPIYLIQKDGFQFYPINIVNPLLSYVKSPPDIVWGFDIDLNQREVYDAANSADPVWQETDCLEILVRALRIAGVNLQFADVSQYANEIKNTGQ